MYISTKFKIQNNLKQNNIEISGLQKKCSLKVLLSVKYKIWNHHCPLKCFQQEFPNCTFTLSHCTSK